MAAPLITAAILAGYAVSLWWLLRGEPRPALLALIVICSLSLTLRLAFTGDYPAGLHDDEPKILGSVIPQLRRSELFAEDSTGLPVLMTAIFQAQLVPLLGPGRWAIRTYSLVTGVLASPVAYAAARGIGLTVGSSLAAGAFLAVLPWSIFWGRVSMGGELPFHQLLLIAALARLIWRRGRFAEVGVGGLGLAGLLYDYLAGRVMLGLPILAAGLASGWRRRLLCLAVLLLALAAWYPYIGSGPRHGIHSGTDLIDPGYAQRPVATVLAKLGGVAAALVSPAATHGALTIASGAMHPPLILALALIGSLYPFRRALFLWGGFLGGLVPTLLSVGVSVSSHRMIMAYPFLLLAAASSFDLLRVARLRHLATAAAVLVIAVQSIGLYFSPAFWPVEDRWSFNADRTALIESLPMPPHPPIYIGPNFGSFFKPRLEVDGGIRLLSVDNWFPPDNTPTTFAFSVLAAPLRPFYSDLLGTQRIQTFGGEFLVHFESRDWSWMRGHGWTYEVTCGIETRRTQIPVMYHAALTFTGMFCPQLSRHTWRGQWHGPAETVRLRFNGHASVAVDGRPLADGQGREQKLDFEVTPGAQMEIQVDTIGNLWAAMMELTPVAEHLPAWDLVTPG